MRSYYSHLTATQAELEQVSTVRKPIFRSSAIFPVLHNQHYTSQILFMGYWLLKRNISEIGLLATLRDEKGAILSRNYLAISSAQAYRIELSEFEAVKNADNFYGSIELEVFSTRDLVFPYPAFVINYYGNNFSTAVHTVGRIYNDLEDLNANQEYTVGESGFDIYGSSTYEPFIAFTNGTIANNTPIIQYKLNNHRGENLIGTITLSPLLPLETRFLRLKEHISNINTFLEGGVGSISISHNFEGFFPRFLVGNFEKDALSITHSYYDCSNLSDEKSYWVRHDERFNDSSVQIPLYITNGYFTQIAIYPIISPSDFTLSLVFFDEQGKQVAFLPQHIAIRSEDQQHRLIDMGEIVRQKNLPANLIKSANIICNWEDKQRVPTRVKFGLNVGKHKAQYSLPCNICFAPALGNPRILSKKNTFRWAPFLNIGTSEVVLTNCGTLKDYQLSANITASFHCENNQQTLDRHYTLQPNEIQIINISKDKELQTFLDNKSGWISLTADNPFVNGWYFDFHESGAVAADHLF